MGRPAPLIQWLSGLLKVEMGWFGTGRGHSLLQVSRNSSKPHRGLHGIVEVDWLLLENTVEPAVAVPPSMYRQKRWTISNPPESQLPEDKGPKKECCCWR